MFGLGFFWEFFVWLGFFNSRITQTVGLKRVPKFTYVLLYILYNTSYFLEKCPDVFRLSGNTLESNRHVFVYVSSTNSQ